MKKLFSRKSPSQRKTSEKKPEDPMLEHYQTRLKGKFVVAVIYLIQIFTRFLSLVEWKEISAQAKLYTWISLAFCFPIPIIITLEYILFRKKGLKMLKYSSLMNGILLFCFIGDWISNEVSCLYVIQGTNPYVAKLIVLLGFTSYAWRTLIVTFIVQNWKLKPLAPSLAIIGVAAFIIIYGTHHLRNVLLGALLQIQLVFIIIQFEEKWKWKLTWTNLKQDQWIQLNDLILNNVPENIMILDMSGEAKFINEQCKTFLKKSNLEAKDFLKRVQDLQRLHDVAVDSEIPVLDNLNMARQASNHEFLEIKAGSMEKAEFLEDLVMDFRNKASLQGGQFLIYNGKLKMPREDGQAEEEDEKSIEVKISCIRNIDKDYLILTLRDTTQREDHLDTFAEAEANKYKDTLLASVSHELRAPLNGNINLVETAIHSPKVPERIKESLLIPALRSSKLLLHKISDLLDMAQIKEKKLRLVFQSEDLKETLKSAAQLVELQAKKKGIELELEFDANLPKKFSTDHIRLSQIVLNLLSNAIKFTKEGVVKLTVAPVNRTSWVKISVKDSGIGIIPDDIKKLFSNSTHTDYEGRQATNPTGVGLGLNVSDKLAELLSPASKQQGIQVVSALNQGSTFSFIIEDRKTQQQQSLNEPFEIASQENSRSNNFTENEISDELPELQSRAFSQLQLLARSSSLCSEAVQSESDVCSCARVLIVDDNPFNTMTLETIFNSLEIKCDAVYSGSACIESLMNRQKKPCCKNCESYSVVFIDQEMPEMDGVETVAEIKRLQKENVIPDMKLVGCAAQRNDEEREKFMEAGLDQCICQPLTTGMIKDILS